MAIVLVVYFVGYVIIAIVIGIPPVPLPLLDFTDLLILIPPPALEIDSKSFKFGKHIKLDSPNKLNKQIRELV